jgi:methyl-accepting chemotaxis protein
VTVADDVGKALAAIITDVGKVTELMNGIARSSEEQAQGVDQVNTAVSQMDKVTQQNAAGAEESASAAEELSAQSQTLRGIVDELAALVSGQRVAGGAGGYAGGAEGARVKASAKPSEGMRVTTASASTGDEGLHDF